MSKSNDYMRFLFTTFYLYVRIVYYNSSIFISYPSFFILFYNLSILDIFQMLHQQGIVMTPAQNQIQDELQRKHEELQQLIVHQQEELRRVSEQLFIARYGILTPLLNVRMSFE